MLKLNLGSGYKRMYGYVNIDNDSRTKPDILRNVERGLPFSDSTVDEVFTSHFLEHVEPDLIHFVMSEIWRVLVQFGKLKVIVPINKGWANSPEHKCPFGEQSHLFFTVWNRDNYKFKLVEKKITGEGVNEELHFTLEAIK